MKYAIAFCYGAFLKLSFGCTSVDQNLLRDASGAICQMIVQATDPKLSPLCSTVEEVEIAIGHLLSNKRAATAHEIATYTPTQDEIYFTVLKLRKERK